MNDMINSPSHYNTGNIEVIDYIIDKLDNPEDYLIGNVLKYVSRYKHKGVPVQDLKKARWYLNKAIELREGKKAKEENK